MKDFWLKLNLGTKVILIFFVFVIILSLIGFANYKPTEAVNSADNSEFINKITNINPILSYPVSYSSEWAGRITLVPAKARELEYAVSNTNQCGGIVNNMDVYFTTNVDSVMIITNKNLQTTETEILKYNNAKNVIMGVSDFDKLNAELSTFQTYCSYFTLYKFDELIAPYPSTDSTRSIVGLGLRKQDTTEDIANVGIYVYVYAAKDDNLIQLSRSLQGNFIFSQSNWDMCKSKSLQKDQNECLYQIYSQDLSMKSKIENEVSNLITQFELANAAE